MKRKLREVDLDDYGTVNLQEVTLEEYAAMNHRPNLDSERHSRHAGKPISLSQIKNLPSLIGRLKIICGFDI